MNQCLSRTQDICRCVEPKIGGFYPKMDGENNGKPYEQMDDLGCFPTIFGNTHTQISGQIIPIYTDVSRRVVTLNCGLVRKSPPQVPGKIQV